MRSSISWMACAQTVAQWTALRGPCHFFATLGRANCSLTCAFDSHSWPAWQCNLASSFRSMRNAVLQKMISWRSAQSYALAVLICRQAHTLSWWAPWHLQIGSSSANNTIQQALAPSRRASRANNHALVCLAHVSCLCMFTPARRWQSCTGLAPAGMCLGRKCALAWRACFACACTWRNS